MNKLVIPFTCVWVSVFVCAMVCKCVKVYKIKVVCFLIFFYQREKNAIKIQFMFSDRTNCNLLLSIYIMFMLFDFIVIFIFRFSFVLFIFPRFFICMLMIVENGVLKKCRFFLLSLHLFLFSSSTSIYHTWLLGFHFTCIFNVFFFLSKKI